MTVISENAADLAIGNIAHFGDTDIFPFPIENRLLYDSPQEVKKVLFEIGGCSKSCSMRSKSRSAAFSFRSAM